MTQEPLSTAELLSAETIFRRRQRILRLTLLSWAIVNIGRAPFIAQRWPAVANAAWVLFGVAAIATTGLLVWAGRCTICGGGIRLNDRTCNRCGHDFPFRWL